MRTFKQEGEVLHYVVPSGATIKSGDLVAVGDVVGVAVTDGVVGKLLALFVEGVYNVAKPVAVGAVTQGSKIYYDKTAKAITTTAGTNPLLGYAWENASASDTEVPVKLMF